MFRFLNTFISYTIMYLNVAACWDESLNNAININDLYYNDTPSITVLDDNGNAIPYDDNEHFNYELSNQSTPKNLLLTPVEIEGFRIYSTKSVPCDRDDSLLQNIFNKLKRENDENECLLNSITKVLRWWSASNGTLRKTNLSISDALIHLDLSHHHINNDLEALKFVYNKFQNKEVVALSLAYNNLKKVPFYTLQTIRKSLKYLSLMGNAFNNVESNIRNCNLKDTVFPMINNKYNTAVCNNKTEYTQWATFPHLPVLVELDISNCSIEFINKNVFKNLTNLKHLYMSSNKILTIPSRTFYYTPLLQVLDLSIANDDLESVIKFGYGVVFEKYVFRYLPNLMYLNLSHSKLSRQSAVAFTYLGANLKYLSLCYTSFPVFSNVIFKNSAIVGLDLSGNSNAAYGITEDVLENLAESLTYLIFEKANIRELSWLKPLYKLRLLALADNNINKLSIEHFSNLRELQILDLTSNQVGNWYSRVFVHNKDLRVLSLSDNNINFINSEMLKDFSILVYLSMGNNNFLCDCRLRDLVEVATINNQQAKCKEDYIHINSTHVSQVWHHMKWVVNSTLNNMDIPSLVVYQKLQTLKRAVQKFTKPNSELRSNSKIRFVLKSLGQHNESEACLLFKHRPFNANSIKINSSIFKLQLLDYGEEGYWCYNETNREHVNGLKCQRSTLLEDIEQELNRTLTYVMATVSSLIFAILLGVVVYMRRWYIYYYYSSLKSAILLSTVSKNNRKQFNNLSDGNPNIMYDIFVSYCQNDREWIVEQFMPNIEESGEICVCLHERDFQVGVTILDNIVSCMERSKALMLIISSDFLLSHWCQFEMQLAQYHLVDLSKEHLILILLEDIPRSKRPKILQYLMDVKTYIKWPGGKSRCHTHLEERKVFWKRLNRAITNISLMYSEFQA